MRVIERLLAFPAIQNACLRRYVMPIRAIDEESIARRTPCSVKGFSRAKTAISAAP